MADQPYPRPDFQRVPLAWQSLNGPWDFLFDDEDVGLSSSWFATGLPATVEVNASHAAKKLGASDESTSITKKIIGETQELIKNNVFAASSASENQKTQIQVPFVFQCPASGINDRGVHEVMWYERAVSDPRSDRDRKAGYRVIARFGAVDYEATVWVNGHYVGGHRGGHVPFEIDITEAVERSTATAEHRLTLRVFDSAYDLTQPRGKQYWGAKPESIFYTPSGGIWQNVWLESVPFARIGDSSHGTVLKSNDIAAGKLTGVVALQGHRPVGSRFSVQLEASFGGVGVSKSSHQLPQETDRVPVELDMRLTKELQQGVAKEALKAADLGDASAWRDGVALWSPEHPQLYDLTIRLVNDESGQVVDEVLTYTGMRSIHWTQGDGHWRLNDKPYFQALCLDQGYWPETFMTPPSQASLKEDIELAKKMGMNGCRKHQKVEDPAFYYWADRMGYLVWGEMANAYQFSPEYVERFDQEWMESVRLAINHPCVVTWTPVNESWGYTDLRGNVNQRNHIRSLYYMTKTLDDTRSINDNCGWEHVLTDLSTFHEYADGPELEKICSNLASILGPKAERSLFVEEIPSKNDSGAKHRPGAPVMCTEFGGVNIGPPKSAVGAGGDEDRQSNWGYTTASNSEDLLKRVGVLIKGVTKGGNVCAFVYTQLTDIEQEANGLYTFDRKEKLDSARVKIIVQEAAQAYYDVAI